MFLMKISIAGKGYLPIWLPISQSKDLIGSNVIGSLIGYISFHVNEKQVKIQNFAHLGFAKSASHKARIMTGSHGGMVIFDVKSQDSFEVAKSNIDLLWKSVKSKIPVILGSIDSDSIESENSVTREEIDNYLVLFNKENHDAFHKLVYYENLDEKLTYLKALYELSVKIINNQAEIDNISFENFKRENNISQLESSLYYPDRTGKGSSKDKAPIKNLDDLLAKELKKETLVQILQKYNKKTSEGKEELVHLFLYSLEEDKIIEELIRNFSKDELSNFSKILNIFPSGDSYMIAYRLLVKTKREMEKSKK